MSIYYVATTGNDSNAGTLASPFLTIQKAVNIANPDDVIIVRNGIYTASSQYFVLFYRSGALGHPIYLRAENPGGAKLNGNNNTSSYAIALAGNVSFLDISGFEIYGFGWAGFDLNNSGSPNTNINIHDNIIHNIGRRTTDSEYGQDGIYLHDVSSITIERNVIHDIGRYNNIEGSPSTEYYKNHDHGIYVDGANGLNIRYNILYNCNRGWGIHFYPAASSNISILNNTFDYGNPYQDATHIILAANLTNVQIKNNIFKGQVNYAIFTYSGTYTNISVTNNIGYGGIGGIVDAATSGVTTSSNLTNTNPLMINPPADFRLQAGSPAINAGVNVGLTTDFAGNSISGLPDIGAYEYQADATTTTTTTLPVTTTTTTTGIVTTTTTTSGIPQSTTTTTTGLPPTTTTSTTLSVYYNVEVSVTVKRDNCPSGYIGGSVIYKVNAGKYSSVISQSDADAQAYDDLNANKQAYANIYGVCTAITVYYNVRMSVKVTRNNCPVGYTGSTVTYTVPAGKYSSTISQADANYKAQLDLDINKQAYANSRGICKKNRSWR